MINMNKILDKADGYFSFELTISIWFNLISTLIARKLVKAFKRMINVNIIIKTSANNF